LLKRFQVTAEQISSSEPIPAQALIPSGQKLLIANHLGDLTYPGALLPDSEAINSPTAAGFNIDEFVQKAGGYLSTYSENVYGEELSGSQIVQRVASEASVSPRLLLAVLEYRSHWVLGNPPANADIGHPIGFRVPGNIGLYPELVLTGTHLNIGYYGWRLGNVLYLKFPDGSQVRLHPELNAGTVAVQYLFSLFTTRISGGGFCMRIKPFRTYIAKCSAIPGLGQPAWSHCSQRFGTTAFRVALSAW